MAGRKKVILFLVEGTSEQDALATPFSQYLKEKVRVEGEAFYCDVTTVSMFPKSARTFVVRSNVKETVRTFVLDQIERKHTYTWQDLAQIVHIVDTDGAFIPDDRVLANEELNGIAYYADHIEHAHPADIIERNHVKAAAIRTLAFVGKLEFRRRAVPYRLLFMSRNLEHALFGIGNNVDGATKERLSRAFAEACRENPQVLVERLCAPGTRVQGDYKETWGFIQEGVHSLERGTNLALLLDAAIPWAALSPLAVPTGSLGARIRHLPQDTQRPVQGASISR